VECLDAEAVVTTRVTCRANHLRDFGRGVVRAGAATARKIEFRERIQGGLRLPHPGAKIFTCAFQKFMIYIRASRANQRGVLANRHETWVAGCNGRQGVERAMLRADERHLADGEVVWS
jgi:hypothetical protein